MKKIYILDTSVLITNPYCLKDFPDSDIVIPITVLDELDKLKKQHSDAGAGRHARVAIRLLDDISNKGDISTGVMTDNSAVVKIDITNYPNEFGDTLYGDTRILSCAFHTNKDSITEFGEGIIFVSKDINLRVRAKALGIETEDYDKGDFSFSELYQGIKTINHIEAGTDLKANGHIDPRCFQFDLCPNECIVLTDEFGNEIAKGKRVASDKIKSIKKSYPWGLSPKNKEQEFAIDLMLDKNIDLVTLIGKAGSGKTLVAIATALEMVINTREYEKLIIYRPISIIGKDIGYLPGDISEKLSPHFSAIMDSLEILLSSKNGDSWKRELEMFQKKDRIQLDCLTYIRGRSIPNVIMLIDEAQNLTKEEVKTILTRAGENTKIIFTGDLDQIDNEKLDAVNNGLTYTVEKFKEHQLAGHITFTECVRSKLASLSASIL